MRALISKAGLDEKQLQNFRQELAEGGGLSSYPHPYLMPDFWQFPTVSMGLGPIMSLYQARFNRYLQARGLVNWKEEPKVWAFLGDGESDEPESLGAITLAARENLDNFIWVVNCNLQRLDGPVRGNGKIIQELEGLFRGAGWNVIKVIWGTEWDDIIKRDKSGLLLKRMEECVDGDYQKYIVEPGSYTRQHFFGKYPELLELVTHLSDEQISKLLRGGHDVRKVYAAYKSAMDHKGQPTVILAKTVKGYGLGEAGEGKNISHQQKKMNEKELREFRARFDIPLTDDVIADMPFYRPPADSPEMKYLLEPAQEARRLCAGAHRQAGEARRADDGSFCRICSRRRRPEVSTTMAFGRLLSLMLAAQGHRTSISCRSFLTKRARLVWTRCSARSGFIRPRASFTNRWTARRCRIITRPRTARFSRKASAKPVRWRRSSPPARATPRTACRWFRFTFTTRCSVRSASAICSGSPATSARKAFCSARLPAAPRSTAKACNIRTATACCTPARFATCLPYDPAFGYELAVIVSRRFAPDVCRERGHFLLPRRLQRKSSDARDARRLSKTAS